LAATSTTRRITATVETTQLSQIKPGQPATVTLPDGTTTPGRVASIGTTATAQTGSGTSSTAPPTVQVGITPADPAATGTADQAPVTVAVTTATVKDALAVPATSLIATPQGQPAIDIVNPDGTTRTESATLGIFDDTNGLVQISGPGIEPGLTVALPAQTDSHT
jgi:multidrug resistance efflux pump